MIEIIKKHKIKIIIAAVVAAVSAITWFYDGMINSRMVSPTPLAATEYEETEKPPLAKGMAALADGGLLEYNPKYTSLTAPALFEDNSTTNLQSSANLSIIYQKEPLSTERTPVEPENMVQSDDSFYVTLSVRVDTLLYNMHLLHRDKHELVPDNGVIFFSSNVRAYEGESVFNVLQREMRRNNIHMASRFTPVFNSAYIEAINNIFEFDAGPLSGWTYRVNGWFPNFGSSRYMIQPGDVIEWLYTVDLGRDVSGDILPNRQGML